MLVIYHSDGSMPHVDSHVRITEGDRAGQEPGAEEIARGRCHLRIHPDDPDAAEIAGACDDLERAANLRLLFESFPELRSVEAIDELTVFTADLVKRFPNLHIDPTHPSAMRAAHLLRLHPHRVAAPDGERGRYALPF